MSVKIFSQKKPILENHPIIGEVAIHERFCVETQNAYGGDFKTEADFEQSFHNPNRNKIHHPCTGPICVKGITKEHSVGVQIHKITIKNTMQSLSVSTGVQKGVYAGRQAHLYQVLHSEKDEKIELGGYTFASISICRIYCNGL